MEPLSLWMSIQHFHVGGQGIHAITSMRMQPDHNCSSMRTRHSLKHSQGMHPTEHSGPSTFRLKPIKNDYPILRACAMMRVRRHATVRVR
jgi:hypothetical protein